MEIERRAAAAADEAADPREAVALPCPARHGADLGARIGRGSTAAGGSGVEVAEQRRQPGTRGGALRRTAFYAGRAAAASQAGLEWLERAAQTAPKISAGSHAWLVAGGIVALRAPADGNVSEDQPVHGRSGSGLTQADLPPGSFACRGERLAGQPNRPPHRWQAASRVCETTTHIRTSKRGPHPCSGSGQGLQRRGRPTGLTGELANGRRGGIDRGDGSANSRSAALHCAQGAIELREWRSDAAEYITQA
jgi:hypothetical protein